jgi:signal transduction histidine kinase
LSPDTAQWRAVGVLAGAAALSLHARRLGAETLAREKKLREAEKELRRTERLAAVGEMVGAIIEEVQKPLSAIGGFARRVSRNLPSGDLNREYVEVIVSEIDRLERVLNEHLELAKLPPSTLRMEDLNASIESVLRSAQSTITEKKARLIKRLAPGLPHLLLDGPKIQQLLAKIVRNLLSTVPAGGRFKVESKRTGEAVQVVFAADGGRAPGQVLERLFEPLRGDGGGDSNISLSLTHQIIREHGGEIGVRSDPDWPVLFVLNLPIKENEDRRRGSADRRDRLRDRRRRPDGREAA